MLQVQEMKKPEESGMTHAYFSLMCTTIHVQRNIDMPLNRSITTCVYVICVFLLIKKNIDMERIKQSNHIEAKCTNSLGKSTKEGNSGRNDPGDINPGKTFKKDFSNLQVQNR